MIRAAFCDDDPSVLNELCSLMDIYRAEHSYDLTWFSFRSPLELLAEIERGVRFDILFLDILMPGENGIDAAAEIRRIDSSIKIIFLSSSAEYAVQSYSVNAFFYHLKPLSREAFEQLMDSVLSACEREQTDSLLLRCKNGITRLNPQRLEYCEVIHRTLFIHLIGGNILETIGSLDELSRYLLPHGHFLRPHRSYLVNLDYVETISYRAIIMASKSEIPIPRGKYNEIKNAFLEYAFQNGQVTV